MSAPLSNTVARRIVFLRPRTPLSTIVRSRLSTTAARAAETGASSSSSSRAAEATSDAAQKAAQTARETATRAAQGLSRVANAAGPALASVARGLSSSLASLSNAGGPVGRTVGFVEKQVPYVVYCFRVAAEMSKMVIHGQKMAPPNYATFQAYYQNMWNHVQASVRDPAARRAMMQTVNPRQLLLQARSASGAQVVTAGVIAAECLGFFTVGEIVGRFKLIGYRGDVGHHE